MGREGGLHKHNLVNLNTLYRIKEAEVKYFFTGAPFLKAPYRAFPEVTVTAMSATIEGHGAAWPRS
jgi:hypothetical protein